MIKIKMTIDECIEFADEWSRGMTIHEGSQGWRVVCMLLANEVRGLRSAISETLDENGHLADGDTCTLAKLKIAIGEK